VTEPAQTTKSAAAGTRRARAAKAVDAPPEKSFWVHDGPMLRNLRELRDALAGEISDEQFAYHVRPDRNDFARWVDEVLGASKCAGALCQAQTRAEALRAVEAALPRRRA
jgi:hypothetical protein